MNWTYLYLDEVFRLVDVLLVAINQRELVLVLMSRVLHIALLLYLLLLVPHRLHIVAISGALP